MEFMFIIPFIMFFITSLLGGAGFVFILIYVVKQRSKNDNAPRLTLEAKVVDKRTVSHRHHASGAHLHHRHYYHYVTFELQDGQRTELLVSRIDFDTLAVSDAGKLTLQGTQFIGFERKREGETV